MAKNAMRKVSNSVSKVVADTKKMSPINLAILVVSVAIVVVLVILLVKRSKREGFALMNLSDASWVTKGEDGVDGVDGEDGEDGAQGPAGTDAGFPSGVIVAYNSNTPPEGWILCDGVTRNGVTPPDLQGKFILASGRGTDLTERRLNDKGGEEEHTLTIEEMPSHTHHMTGMQKYGRPDGGYDYKGGWGGNGYGYYVDMCANPAESYQVQCKNFADTFGSSTNNTGGNKPHNNMPPFYVLTYIMKL